ncbi:ABC transporter permease subunit [Isobaculum melis]|uniref:Putative lysine transport system permease protein n=1 Tax=Isobaculum melis TaxID=142588 RepID=A0A1H9R5M5_9LACT|nr:putative lysine transport system permease protein [Isobaculum melis]
MGKKKEGVFDVRKKIGYLFSMFAVIVVLISGCGGAGDSKDDTFVVGMEAGYAPFNWTQSTDANGAVKIDGSADYAGGYDVALAQKVADGLGKKLVIVKTEWDGLIPALTSGKIDAVMAGMSPTDERRQSIDFSENYYKSHLVLVVKKGGAYDQATSLQDFSGAKITAQLNTFHYSVIDQMPGVVKETAMDNFSSMRVALQSGVIDGYISELPEGITAEAANNSFKMIELEDGFQTAEEDTDTAVGLVKNSALKADVNQILAEISEEERADLMEAAIKNQPAETDTEDDADSGTVIDAKDSSLSFAWIVKIVSENGPMFLRGAGVTLLIALVGTIIGTLIGLLIGVIRTIPKPDSKVKRTLLKIINSLLSIYIEIFRGTPMIVQAMVIYYGSALAFGVDMNRLFAAIFIVSINTGAYMSEIVRGGILSIDKGQFEAAHAIGMNHLQTMKNVVLPQVMRNILPATGNEFVINIKDTSVLNVISVTELYFQTKSVAGNNFRYFESFFVACVIYFIMTFTVTRILRAIEKRLDGPENYVVIQNQMQVQAVENTVKREED